MELAIYVVYFWVALLVVAILSVAVFGLKNLFKKCAEKKAMNALFKQDVEKE